MAQGDHNTKSAGNLNEKFSSMSSVVMDGVHFDVLRDIKLVIYNFYKSLLIRSNSRASQLMHYFYLCYGILIKSFLRWNLVSKKLPWLFLIVVGIRLLDQIVLLCHSFKPIV